MSTRHNLTTVLRPRLGRRVFVVAALAGSLAALGCGGEDIGAPGYPGSPSTPGAPGDPGDPGDPSDPGDPGDPSAPGDPGDPGDPSVPGDPSDPGDPGDPGNVPTQGSVEVTLTPGNSVTVGQPTLIAFGVPFPPGTTGDISELVLTNASDAEIASHVEELVRWRSLGDSMSRNSVRSALFYAKVTFANKEPMVVKVHWGSSRSQELGAQAGGVKSTWVSIGGETNPREYSSGESIKEPNVYATLPAQWLGDAVIRTKTTPVGDSSWSWFDDFLVGAGKTAVNDVDPRVTAANLIDYEGGYSAWLFDRAMTLYNIYVRTGDVEWARHAHRAAQFYKNHVNSRGYFDLKDYDDLKYSYGEAMLADFMFTGDVSLIAVIERVAEAGEGWPETYKSSMNFWTERHQNYALLAALSAWEATGKQAHADRVHEIVDASIRQATTAQNGFGIEGCLVHELGDHEGGSDPEPVCSPWMSALFADGMFRYYMHSGDTQALSFLGGLGDFVATSGVYFATEDNMNLTLPWYLASSSFEWSDDGAWGDFEHACDVSGLLARGKWAKNKLGQSTSTIDGTLGDMLVSCQENLANWYRPTGPSSGKAIYRVSPTRKFSWWFGTTSDLQWLLKDSGGQELLP